MPIGDVVAVLALGVVVAVLSGWVLPTGSVPSLTLLLQGIRAGWESLFCRELHPWVRAAKTQLST